MDEVASEEPADAAAQTAALAPGWDPSAFFPRATLPPPAAEGWSWPPLAAFEASFARYDEDARPLRVADAFIVCADLAGALRCADDDLYPLDRRRVLVGSEQGGWLRWNAVGAGGPHLCRGTCAVRDSHYEVVDGDLGRDAEALVLEDGGRLELEIRGRWSPSRPAADLWDAWVYAHVLVAFGQWTDEARARHESDGEDPPGEHEDVTAESRFHQGDVASYLVRRLRHIASHLEHVRDGRPALAPGIAPRELGRGPIDLDRLILGLLLRFDLRGDDDAYAPSPWQAGAHYRPWHRAPLSPPPDVLAYAIADAGRSEGMATRLRELWLDRELDRYNRMRAVSTLMVLLQIDPGLVGRPTREVRSSLVFEAFQTEAADVLAGGDDVFQELVGRAFADASRAERATSQATLHWLL